MIKKYTDIIKKFAVRGWGARNVSDRESETLLHCHEKTRKKKASKSYQTADESSFSDVLRSIQLEKVNLLLYCRCILTVIL